ncbi:hypothetical protein SFRURICE_007075 [Spodoptera frugiperda]|uniref:SFRICE_014062 n=1 Tax=Spodoptera frugiperda TaxID=7108 RepID=A0A2H1V730_SPOFR|nr:hypothetical protein SFRURICE_007075 [Spodoptera frugiperda]
MSASNWRRRRYGHVRLAANRRPSVGDLFLLQLSPVVFSFEVGLEVNCAITRKHKIPFAFDFSRDRITKKNVALMT